jgi:uncharacterized protein (TIGR02217 family)
MPFYPVEIDACPAYGWQGGPNANVLIKTLANRHEKRNRQGDLMQHTFNLPFQNIKDDAYLQYIKAAFMALGGPTDSFLTKDYGDFLAVGEPQGLAPASSTPVQLIKTYSFQGVAFYSRVITKPLAASVVMRQDGVVKAGTTSPLTGLFTPTTAWTPGAELEADFEFRVPVRFDGMSLPSTIDNRIDGGYAVNGSASLIEVFGE